MNAVKKAQYMKHANAKCEWPEMYKMMQGGRKRNVNGPKRNDTKRKTMQGGGISHKSFAQNTKCEELSIYEACESEM